MKKDILDKRRTIGEKIFYIIAFLILFVWSAIMLYMFFWAIVSSLKTNWEFLKNPLGFPKELKWSNYSVAIKKMEYNNIGIWGMLWNSTWYVVGSSLIGVFTVCTTGYIIAQYNFKGKDILFVVVLFTMIIPLYGSQSATYKLVYDLKIDNSYLFLITSFSGFGGNFLITHAFFKGVSRTYREAVYIDGGSHLTAYLKVMLPQAKGIFIALFILSFIAGWNNYETPLLYLEEMPVVASGLYYFEQNVRYASNQPAYIAGSLLAMLPVVILLCCFANQIMGKMYFGGLKG